ncbi:MAG TPA: thioredoxin family protein [Phycisphaerae bacterium]|nr:thioredoxin family protein [Phycisphaerae bacterium]HOM50992.1 thioredoxin family protein [Phycisphaerae bacterium]HON69373.1 thioredoxin family protein [Phycisphaerae bacterium]HPP25779.1 thioredoxin family protein [Phycisphaerae bacterium]
MDWQQVFNRSLKYDAYLQTGTSVHRDRWRSVYDRVQLTEAQRSLLASFTRRMNVFCLSGVWCGDCVNQCPILQRLAEANPLIDLRFFDRDEDTALRSELSINGGQRVPVVVFLSEDFYECGRYGDRTLSTYRRMAANSLGAACPTGIVPAESDSMAAVVAEWLAEFERIQLILRLSARLRSKYGD